MRKFWVLLFAFLLPIQMSWAAVHFCAESGAPALVAVASGGEHGQSTHGEGESSVKDAEGKKTGQLGDTCCCAAHGCHGLHSVMLAENRSLIALSAASVLPRSNAPPPQREVVTRHERPQWPVA